MVDPGDKRRVKLVVQCDYSETPGKINVKWDYNPNLDQEFDLRQWDFLTLHKAAEDPENYQASRYMLSHKSGQIDFSAPLEAGSYAVSVLRDRVIVAKQMVGPRRTDFLNRFWVDIKNELESLEVLSTEIFEFDPT